MDAELQPSICLCPVDAPVSVMDHVYESAQRSVVLHGMYGDREDVCLVETPQFPDGADFRFGSEDLRPQHGCAAGGPCAPHCLRARRLPRASIPAPGPWTAGGWKHEHEAYAATGKLCVMSCCWVLFWGLFVGL